MTTARASSSALTSLVVASRYVPVYLALTLLVIVASISSRRCSSLVRRVLSLTVALRSVAQ